MRTRRALLVLSLVGLAIGICGVATPSASPTTGVEPPPGWVVVQYPDLEQGLTKIVVTNTSYDCCLRSFTWLPPVGMKVKSVTSATGGRCSLVRGIISCVVSANGLASVRGCPQCRVIVNFLAPGYKGELRGKYWVYGARGTLKVTG